MATFFQVNFEVSSNEDFRYAFALKEPEALPVDLTGASLAMSISDRHRQLDLSTDNGLIEIVDAAEGQFMIAVPQATLSTLPPLVYQHDLLLRQNGETHRIWQGTLTLNQGITR